MDIRPGSGEDGSDAPGLADEAPVAAARLITLDQGLYALDIGRLAAASAARYGMTLPIVQLSSPPSGELDPVDILTAGVDQNGWIGPEGGTAVVRAPPGGGQILATLYHLPDTDTVALSRLEIRRLDQRAPDPAPRVPEAMASADGDGDVAIEITSHFERLGDRSFAGGVWCGTVGEKLQIEAFGIRPLDRIAEAEIEYKAFGPGGRETRWVSDGKLCGTRGRGIPLTGFAVRLAPHLADRFDVIYQGAFFATGTTAPARDGEPCQPPLVDDTLEAIMVRVIERSPT